MVRNVLKYVIEAISGTLTRETGEMTSMELNSDFFVIVYNIE